MDISSENDINKLKALAYDQMLDLERIQSNLVAINSRIAAIDQMSKAKEAVTDDSSDSI